MCLERTPSWSIEFQRDGLDHAIADPATGPDQKRATPGPQVRLALPRLTTTTTTTSQPTRLVHFPGSSHHCKPPRDDSHRNLARWGIAAGPASTYQTTEVGAGFI